MKIYTFSGDTSYAVARTLRYITLSLSTLLIVCSCKPPNTPKDSDVTTEMTESNEKHAHTNRLINAASPYLLQHAHNPVDWYPWGKEALNKAKEEDKPIIVSIGYSSCHWCHVMERESFENDSIAVLMNAHFINIKVDREERPDVDQVYMEAVQAMGLGGGWPLNVFLTPDQKPFYGGTYFPPQNWAKLLGSIHDAYQKDKGKLLESAEKFTESLSQSDIEKYGLQIGNKNFDTATLNDMYALMEEKFDITRGGMDRSPKFPMPSNWMFLLRYFAVSGQTKALDQVLLTLDEIAMGGIYDQIGGGFARYSTDAKWFAPHFEKMLYDNGQLLSLYAEAYTLTGKDLYRQVVYETVDWLKREMINDDNGFYAALDADSEGEEGKFYVWTKSEMEAALKDSELAELMFDYYHVEADGNWEHGNNILHKRESDEVFAEKHSLSLEDLMEKVHKTKGLLLEGRSKKERPGLDDKALAAWNGLMLKGLIDAYTAFAEEDFLKLALKNARFVESKLRKGERLLRSYKAGKSSINGYLEDYAFVAQAYIALYQATFDEAWLIEAQSLVDYTMKHFYDEEEKMFFYTDDSSERLIARKKEIFDNVIPASNSAMAVNLYHLGLLLDKKEYMGTAKDMLSQVTVLLEKEPGYLSNWGILYSYLSQPTAEIAIVGKNYKEIIQKIHQKYIPNKVLVGAADSSALPLMENRYAMDGKTTIYVCYNKACKLPVHTVEEAFSQLD